MRTITNEEVASHTGRVDRNRSIPRNGIYTISSRLIRDAWIETDFISEYIGSIGSRLIRDAWIETVTGSGNVVTNVSRLIRDAWIETGTYGCLYPCIRSRLIRDAWIETLWRLPKNWARMVASHTGRVDRNQRFQ